MARATAEERRLFRLFQATVKGCEIVYAAERVFYLHLARSPIDDWTPIDETKRPIAASDLHDGSSVDEVRRASVPLTRERESDQKAL